MKWYEQHLYPFHSHVPRKDMSVQNDSTGPTMLDFAAGYARRGLRVLPLHSFYPSGCCTCGQAQCSSPGKHPRTKDGAISASCDLDQVQLWWDRYPQANVGIATGGGLLVVDIDPRHGGSLEVIERLVELPEKTPLVRTGGGGWHLYFLHDRELIVPNSSGRLAEGIDIRGHHGYVVAPASLHASGRHYLWRVFGDIPRAPERLLDLALTSRKQSSSHAVILPRPGLPSVGAIPRGCPAPTDPTQDAPVGAIPRGCLPPTDPTQDASVGAGLAPALPPPIVLIIPEGKRNTRLLSVAGDYRRQGASEEGLLLMLRAYNQAFCRPPLPDEEVIKIVRSVAKYPSGATVRRSGAEDALDAQQILARTSVEPQWAIPGLLAEGVTLLGGKPKMGKSWLALHLALAVALGENALSSMPTRQGYVFYLGLEDTERRMKDRLAKLLQGREAPENLLWTGSWHPLMHGGLDDLDAWVASKPNPRLVIIDTLARVRSPGSGNIYADDYALITPLKQLAEQHHISILVIHHLRKGGNGGTDPMDEISGSTGLTGATDCNMVLQRARNEMTAQLFVTGRDVEEQQLTLTFDEQTALWSLEKDAGPNLSSTERTILDLLRERGEAMSPLEIAITLGKERASVRKALFRLKEKGLIIASSRGLYLLSGQSAMLWEEDGLDTPNAGNICHNGPGPAWGAGS